MLDLCAEGREALWAATGEGLVRIGPHGETSVAPPFPLDSSMEVRIAVGPDGALRLRARGEHFQRDASGAWGRVAAFPLPAPLPLRFHGSVWSARSDRGIRRERQLFRRIDLPGISNVNALALAPDGAVWCGADDGVARVAGGAVERTRTIGGTSLAGVTACAVDREGRVWIGSGGGFTGLFRREGDQWKRLGAAEGFVDAFVHRITMDPTGALWFSILSAKAGAAEGGGGAYVFAEGRFRPAVALKELPSSRVYDVIARDPQGVLWFATLRGLASHEGNRVTHHGGLLSERIFCLEAARDGSLWIGYQRGAPGISRLSRGELRHFTEGPAAAEVWSIAEGEPGVLWFATAKGLVRFDGKRWSRFDAGAYPLWPLLPTEDGAVYVGTLGGGLLRFDPEDRLAPRTAFEPGDRPRWRARDAFGATPEEEIWFRYRIDRGRWSEPSPARGFEGRLAPGLHRIEVQAIDLFGNAEDPPAELEFEVSGAAPPWLWATIALAAALGALAVARLRRR